MEEELFEAMRKVADWFNWDLSKREDPDRDDIASGNVWPECDRCGGTGHNAADHDSMLLDRIKAEIAEYNRKLTS